MNICRRLIRQEQAPAPRTIVPSLLDDRVQEPQLKYPLNKVTSTKYNIFSFLPLSLLVQFTRITNVFYVVNVILQSQPSISTNNPLATSIPLAFVITLGVIREMIDDLKRWKEDRKTNSRLYNIVITKDLKLTSEVRSDQLRVGDIIELYDDQTVPADCILLSTYDPNGQCFVQTSSLDGEKNYKPRFRIRQVQENLQEILTNGGNMELSYPGQDKNLYQFSGNLNFKLGEEDKKLPIGLKQFIHCGSIIRNSDKILAMIVYTGKQTKIFLNQGRQTFKQSKMEKKMNLILIFNLFIFFTIMGSMAARLFVYLEENSKTIKYLYPKVPNASTSALKVFGSFYSLMNQLIPLAMVVTVEIAKVLYTRAIENDVEMMSYDNHQQDMVACRVQNMALHEELGQINYILTDKTGTLTQNELVFRVISFNGKIFECSPKELYQVTFEHHKDPKFQDFWRCICICNDVHTIVHKKIKHLSGASQDEIILLKAASESTIAELFEKDTEQLTIMMGSEEEKYDIVKVIEFTPERRMMSVVVKSQSTQKLYIFSKGGDDKMSHTLKSKSLIDQETLDNVNHLANRGFRTLVFGMKEITNMSEAEIKDQSLNPELLEIDLTFLGISGVEDLLQEEVSECITEFHEAGINIWMLTGDKGETALQVAKSCGLIKEDFQIFMIHESDTGISDKLEKINTFAATGKQYGFLLPGIMTSQIFTDETLKTEIMKIFKTCQAVVLFRSSPAQKAEMVNFVKKNIKGSVTLSIGDGANDCNMILQGHVGIGIFGKEGHQAACVSDYAVPKFKHLRRLMFWHGRGFATRLSNFVKWYLWKCIIFASTLLFMNQYTAYSGTTFYSDLYYAVYKSNLFAIAILIYLTYEQDVDFRLSAKESEIGFKLSTYYKHCRDKVLNTTLTQYLAWFIWGMASGLAIFYIPSYAYMYNYHPNGKTEGMYAAGFAAVTIMHTSHTINLGFSTRHWTIYVLIGYILAYAEYMPLMVFFNDITANTAMEHITFTDVFNQPQWWLSVVLTTGMLVLPYYAVSRIWHLIMYPQFMVK